jgi:hypothetical protein
MLKKYNNLPILAVLVVVVMLVLAMGVASLEC